MAPGRSDPKTTPNIELIDLGSLYTNYFEFYHFLPYFGVSLRGVRGSGTGRNCWVLLVSERYSVRKALVAVGNRSFTKGVFISCQSFYHVGVQWPRIAINFQIPPEKVNAESEKNIWKIWTQFEIAQQSKTTYVLTTFISIIRLFFLLNKLQNKRWTRKN